MVVFTVPGDGVFAGRSGSREIVSMRFVLSPPGGLIIVIPLLEVAVPAWSLFWS